MASALQDDLPKQDTEKTDSGAPSKSPSQKPEAKSSESVPPTPPKPKSDGGETSETPPVSGDKTSTPGVDEGGSTKPSDRVAHRTPTHDGKPETPPVSGDKTSTPGADESGSAKPSDRVVHKTATYDDKPDLKQNPHTLDGSSDICTLLESTAVVLSAVLKRCRQEMKNRQTIELLIPRVRNLAKSLKELAPEVEVTEEQRSEVLARKLWEVLQDLAPLVGRGSRTSFLEDTEETGRLISRAEDIHEAVMEYQTALLSDACEKDCQLTDPVDRSLLNGMYHTVDAGYLSGKRQGCLRGTRRDVLVEIEQWSATEEDKRVFWLNGLAGTGKSTIARTFAKISFADGELGASFFCSRDFEDRSDLQAIFPTLAFQLAHRYLEFQQQLLQVLRENPAVARESLCSQLEKLIIRPLKATKICTLIIIDALDECKDKDPASALLYALSCYINEIPEVKFFITGRPEPRIQEGFRQELLLPITTEFKLHDVKRSLVDEDIRLYLKTHLTNIRAIRKDCEFPGEWPSAFDIKVLCDEAAGFFIYASTVVKFVASAQHKPTERLDQIILPRKNAAHEGGIDLLYTQILELAFCDVHSEEREPYSRFRIIVGLVLLVFHPLSRKALSDLVRTRETVDHISATLDSLHSLLDIPKGEGDPIRVFHKSFPDFLTDQTRCKEDRFFVDPLVHHEDILFSCLGLMKERLKKNICGFNDYAILGDDQGPASNLKKTSIESSLEYACRFWTKHLVKVPGKGTHVKRVQEAIDEFFTKHLLCWIEVLSVTEHLGEAVYAINDIRQWHISAGTLTSTKADDSERFILEHFDVIRDSPSHIYHSALPLSPSSSWLRKCYEAEVAQEVKVLMGLPEKWDACSRTIPIEDHPRALAYWKDIIAVGLESKRVVLLDAITGKRKSALYGHTGVVFSLAFSPDGTLLVSGSKDRTVKLWDVQTGGVIKTFSDRSHPISSVSISPDRTTIAAGARSGNILLWDVRTGKNLAFGTCHKHIVTAISFSPTNSRRLISSSEDGTVQQWEADGHQIGTVHHEGAEVTHVAYASDGSRFVSCGGAVAKVRDAESGAVVVELNAPDQELEFKYCCFSPDGRFVACAAGPTIYIWDIADSKAHLAGTLVGHARDIISIDFSSSIISGSEDQSVKFWQSNSFLTDSPTTEDMPIPSGSSSIESINVFAEVGTIVTSNSSGSVKIWDLKTGKCTSSFSTPARGVRDTHLAGDVLTIVWRAQVEDDEEYHVFDVKNCQPLPTIPSTLSGFLDLRISGDGSKIFGLNDEYIEVVFIRSGKPAVRVQHWGRDGRGSLVVHGSKVWLAGSKEKGWDLRSGKALPFSLQKELPDHFRLGFVDRSTRHNTQPAWIQHAETECQVFRLPERYMKPGTKRRWDGQYLIVYSPSGDVVVMDFGRVCPR